MSNQIVLPGSKHGKGGKVSYRQMKREYDKLSENHAKAIHYLNNYTVLAKEALARLYMVDPQNVIFTSNNGLHESMMVAVKQRVQEIEQAQKKEMPKNDGAESVPVQNPAV